MNIITIHVHSILNSKLATTSDHSDLLFEEIKGKLKSFNLVEVNFSNVSVMNFNFTSALVRRLYIEQIEINSLLFIGLTPSQKRLFSTTKELTLQKIGKSNKTKYPETKDEIIFFLSNNEHIVIKVNSLEAVKEIYKFIKNFSGKNVYIFNELLESTTYFLSRNKEDTKLLNYGYLFIKPTDKFILIEPVYMETNELENNSNSWKTLA